MTRHKHELHVYGSLEKFKSYEQMAERLGKRQVKESTLDYAESAANIKAKREQARAAEKQSTATPQNALGNRSTLSAAMAAMAERAQARAQQREGKAEQSNPQSKLDRAMEAVKERAQQREAGQQPQPKPQEKDQGHEM